MSIAEQSTSTIDAHDFLRGQRDCRDGVDHRVGQSSSYDRGYAAQYEWEQVRAERTRHD